MNINQKLLKITTIVLDVDGVLTDGSVGYSSGEEIKFFNVKDGLGIKLAQKAGLKVGIISGRSSQANKIRAKELGLDFLYEGKRNKGIAFDSLLKEYNLIEDECLYIGDDLIDVPILKRTGVAVIVGDACNGMDDFCDIRTKLFGGRGAIRETIEILLQAQNKWDSVISQYIT